MLLSVLCADLADGEDSPDCAPESAPSPLTKAAGEDSRRRLSPGDTRVPDSKQVFGAVQSSKVTPAHPWVPVQCSPPGSITRLETPVGFSASSDHEPARKPDVFKERRLLTFEKTVLEFPRLIKKKHNSHNFKKAPDF